MTGMCRTILTILVVISIIPATFADIAVEGVSQYDYQYKILNYEDFPDYLFITSSAIWGWEYPQVVTNGTFGGGYKLDGFILHAVPMTNADPKLSDIIDELNSPSSESNQVDGSPYSDYFSTHPVLTANISLPVGTFYEDTLGIDNVSVYLTITNLDGTSFNLTKDEAVFGYTSDQVIKVPLSGDEDPLPPSSP